MVFVALLFVKIASNTGDMNALKNFKRPSRTIVDFRALGKVGGGVGLFSTAIYLFKRHT